VKYKVIHGDDEPLYIEGFGAAQEVLLTAVKELESRGALPHWRAIALVNQVDNMPRAGFSFATDDGVLVGVEKA